MYRLLVVLAVAVATSDAYSAGAPESVCDDMTPKHPVAPKTTPLPYTVRVSTKEARKGEIVDITISGKKPFKGYFIQVRDGDKAVGSFQIPDTDRYSKTVNCHGTNGSAATHKNSVEKNDLTLQWKAPNSIGNLKVFVTVAENGGVFWAAKETQAIKIH